ncbi:MAG: 4'-phosphopantetheinyl transferase family protein [Acidimicrobiales bacterium]
MTTWTDLSVLDARDRAWAAARPTRAAAQKVATGRALVRLVLGSLLDVDPRGVPLDRTCAVCGRAHGRPRHTPDGGAAFEVSTSRAGDRGMLAVSTATAVGVDVERLRPVRAAARRARDLLPPTSADEVARAMPGEAGPTLLRHWVRHEALVKASTPGLPAGHRRVEVGDHVDPGRRVLRAGEPGPARGWWLGDVRVERGWVAAVTVRQVGAAPIQFRPLMDDAQAQPPRQR